MAPKKRPAKQDDEPAKPTASSRVTRSSARVAANSKSNSTSETLPEIPKKKKAKRSPKENGKEEARSEEVETGKEKEEVDASEKLGDDTKSRTIVIEHCKQCQSFKKRAVQVQEGLEKGISGINVLVNPDKPRRGCFEIRREGGEKFISLLNMKRPFTPMKELNMEEVISDIIKKIEG